MDPTRVPLEEGVVGSRGAGGSVAEVLGRRVGVGRRGWWRRGRRGCRSAGTGGRGRLCGSGCPGNNWLDLNSLGQCFNLACCKKILGQCVNNLGQYRPDNSEKYCPTLVKSYLIPILFSDNLPTYKFYDIFPISNRYKKQISTKMKIC